MQIHKVVGSIYAVTVILETIAIILVLISLCRLRLWRSLPFYYLATANLVNDLAMTLVHGVYMTPSILAEVFSVLLLFTNPFYSRIYSPMVWKIP